MKFAPAKGPKSRQTGNSSHHSVSAGKNARSLAPPPYGLDFVDSVLPNRAASAGPRVQAKLEVSEPDDPYEREADRVAETVMRMPAPGLGQEGEDEQAAVELSASSPGIQRACEACEQEGERQAPPDNGLQARAAPGGVRAPSAGAGAAIEGLKGTGRPLPGSERAFFEPRFGHDFGRVRIHADEQGDRAARSINAQAFTLGSDMAFRAGAYRPGTRAGRELLAHELTHTVQQGGAGQAPSQCHSRDAVMPGRASQAAWTAHITASNPILQRQEAAAAPATALKPRVVQGEGGYSYEQHPDGTLVIRSGPGIRAPVRLTEGKAFDSITAEIGHFPGAPKPGSGQPPLAAGEVPEGGGWVDWLANQKSKVGEAASDLFTTGGEWAEGLADYWTSDEAPAQDAPVAPGERGGEAEAAKFEGMTGTPLELALEKVGQVAYVDPKFGKGAGEREFTKAETGALKSGSEGIKVASCSPFAYWTLAASGIDINVDIEGDEVSIREYINIESGALKGGDYGTLVKGGDERIKGAATAFEKAKIGTEVEKNEACPGDYVQTYGKGLGGHSTIVHRAHCKGAAIFGLAGSPKPQGALPSGEGPIPAGFGGEPVTFTMDERTDPATVGTFVTEKVELLGAHLGGTSSAGEKEGPGVYTKKAASLDSYYRAFVGRLSSSVWANHKPADPAKFLETESASGADADKGSWWKLW